MSLLVKLITATMAICLATPMWSRGLIVVNNTNKQIHVEFTMGNNDGADIEAGGQRALTAFGCNPFGDMWIWADQQLPAYPQGELHPSKIAKCTIPLNKNRVTISGTISNQASESYFGGGVTCVLDVVPGTEKYNWCYLRGVNEDGRASIQTCPGAAAGLMC